MEPIKRPHFRRQVQGQARHIHPSISSHSDIESSSSRYSTSSSSSSKRIDPALSHLRASFGFGTPFFSQTPALEWAITSSSPQALLAILAHYAISPHQKIHFLHLAISHGSKDSTRILLDHGADVNGLDTNGINPIQAAIREKGSRESIAKMLIERGADLALGSPLHWAARRNWPEVVEMLCLYGVDVDRPSNSCSSSMRRDRNRNRNVEIEGITALHIASYYDSLASAEVLIRYGAAVELHTSSGELALAEAISNRSVNMVDLLLSSGISIHAAIDGSGGTPLMAACCLDDVQLVRCLMRHGARETVECRDKEGETAISTAAVWAGREVLEVLVDVGADVHVRNERGETPLQLAVRKGRPVEVLEVLLRAGARRDEGIEVALEEAVREAGGKFDFAVVDLLNRYGRPAGRRRGCERVTNGSSYDEMSQRSDETLRRGSDTEYDRRVTRYVQKSSSDFTHSSTRRRSPSPSISFDDRTSTAFDSAWYESKWDPSQLSVDRRMMKWSAERYERPDAGIHRVKRRGLFGETWGEEFDGGFDEAFGSERSEYSFGRGRSKGRGRGRFTNIVSFTVYA